MRIWRWENPTLTIVFCTQRLIHLTSGLFDDCNNIDIPIVKECLTNARTLQNQPEIEAQDSEIDRLITSTLSEVNDMQDIFSPSLASTILLPEINGDATVPNQLGKEYYTLKSKSENVYKNVNSPTKGNTHEHFINGSFNYETYDPGDTFINQQGLDTASNYNFNDPDITGNIADNTQKEDDLAELNLSEMDFLENFDDLSQWSISEMMNAGDLAGDLNAIDSLPMTIDALIKRGLHDQLPESPLVNTSTCVPEEESAPAISNNVAGDSATSTVTSPISPLHDHLGYAKPTQLVTPVLGEPVKSVVLGKRGRPAKRSVAETNNIDGAPITEEMKRDERRRKNNEASKVSRAKRKKRQAQCVVDEIQLSQRNAELKEQMEDISRQCSELKSKLFAALKSKN